MTADIVVLSKSSFSFVPAILNMNATVFYTPYWQRRMSRWTVDYCSEERRGYEATHQGQMCRPKGVVCCIKLCNE